MSRLLAPVLYTALAAFANPGLAQMLTDDQRAGIEALREGDMRKLVVHPAPVPTAADVAFTDRAGSDSFLADSNGRIRLVNFWATWCAPCRQEKPALDALQRERGGDNFQVIAIATGRNDLDAIDRFNADLGITSLDTWLDPDMEVAGAMQVPGLPVTVVLNRAGNEIARLMGGADWTSESARAIVDYLIALPD
jgi:thiol-disulfide isomerase/thioredoxin